MKRCITIAIVLVGFAVVQSPVQAQGASALVGAWSSSDGERIDVYTSQGVWVRVDKGLDIVYVGSYTYADNKLVVRYSIAGDKNTSKTTYEVMWNGTDEMMTKSTMVGNGAGGLIERWIRKKPAGDEQ